MSSSTTSGADFYFQFPVVIIGVVGAAANALILYAMIASNQHKKQLLIFNQNIFDDLWSSICRVSMYTIRHCKASI